MVVNNPLRRPAISRGIWGFFRPLDLHEKGEAAMPRISHPTGVMKLQYRNGGRNSWFTKCVDLIYEEFYEQLYEGKPFLTFTNLPRHFTNRYPDPRNDGLLQGISGFKDSMK